VAPLGPLLHVHVWEKIAAKVDKASAQMYASNIWPERPHDFKQTMTSYYDAMMGLASNVLRAMATALEVNENYFADKFDRQASVCRIIRYPAVTQPPLPGQLRAGTHTESGRYSVEDWLRIYAAHAHNHAAQIRRARWGARGSA
jgi:isopenicillin N synthase-like dioxygenase